MHALSLYPVPHTTARLLLSSHALPLPLFRPFPSRSQPRRRLPRRLRRPPPARRVAPRGRRLCPRAGPQPLPAGVGRERLRGRGPLGLLRQRGVHDRRVHAQGGEGCGLREVVAEVQDGGGGAGDRRACVCVCVCVCFFEGTGDGARALRGSEGGSARGHSLALSHSRLSLSPLLCPLPSAPQVPSPRCTRSWWRGSPCAAAAPWPRASWPLSRSPSPRCGSRRAQQTPPRAPISPASWGFFLLSSFGPAQRLPRKIAPLSPTVAPVLSPPSHLPPPLAQAIASPERPQQCVAA